jgi:hypothetical protein
MSQTPQQEPTSDPRAVSLSRSFSRFGWTGFWLQVVLGSLPVFTLVYYFAFTGSVVVPRSFPFVEYLAAINLLTLLFTTLWSYRYTRLARRIRDPKKCPTPAYLARSVWTGVILSAVGMFFSALVILIESANLTFYFLRAPQAGVPVIQTSGTEAVRFVSAVDMISLMSLILPLFAEQIVMMFNLRLLRRTTPKPAEHHPWAEGEESAPAAEDVAHSPTGRPAETGVRAVQDGYSAK